MLDIGTWYVMNDFKFHHSTQKSTTTPYKLTRETYKGIPETYHILLPMYECVSVYNQPQ